jgi:hypothetical protein
MSVVMFTGILPVLWWSCAIYCVVWVGGNKMSE